MKGGIGSASVTVGGITVGALVAVNAIGDVIDPANGARRRRRAQRRRPRAARHDGGAAARRTAAALAAGPARPRSASSPPTPCSTKAQANKLAQMAHDGLARSINPVHTHGRRRHAVRAGHRRAAGAAPTLTLLGALAAEVTAEAVLRAVRAATALTGRPAACRRRATCRRPECITAAISPIESSPMTRLAHPPPLAHRRRCRSRCWPPAPARPTHDDRPPIVFVHGNGDTAALWMTTLWRFESNGWPRERLHRDRPALPAGARRRRQAAARPHARPPSTCSSWPPRSTRCCARTGAREVVLIGNSRGGNAIRNYIANGGGAAKVSHAILGGTPNHGVWANPDVSPDQRVQRRRAVPDRAEHTRAARASRSRPA